MNERTNERMMTGFYPTYDLKCQREYMRNWEADFVDGEGQNAEVAIESTNRVAPAVSNVPVSSGVSRDDRGGLGWWY